jgi:hypothetical protein
MKMQNASCVKWAGLAMLLVVPTGCVINPYVKAPTDSAWNLGKACSQLEGKLVTPDANANNDVGAVSQSMQYAICTQRAMERKAGKYAWMNNGGALLLMHMAGLAGYSGTRGGHTAQVTAMTTGGATFYGAQQYLYRKPREAIYWMGSEAMMCAISVTNRRLVSAPDPMDPLSTFHADHVVKPLGDFRALVPVEQAARDALRRDMPVKCSDPQDEALRARATVAMDHVESLLDAVSVKTFERDSARFRVLLAERGKSAASAKSDLINATNAIRAAVNRQIAVQQPDPTELAKLLNGLKLPALSGPTTAAASTESLGKPAAHDERGDDGKNKNKNKNKSRKAAGCVALRSSMHDYLRAAGAFSRLHGDLTQARTDFMALHAAIEMREAQELPIEQCLHLRGNALGPFRLVLAQAGAIELKKGESTTLPIEGGTPPFRIEPIDKDDLASAKVRPTALGGYEIVVEAKGNAPAKARFFASDNAGGSAMFTVQINP